MLLYVLGESLSRLFESAAEMYVLTSPYQAAARTTTRRLIAGGRAGGPRFGSEGHLRTSTLGWGSTGSVLPLPIALSYHRW